MPADLNDYFKNRGGDKKPSGGGNSGGSGGRKPPEVPEFMKDFGKKTWIIYLLIGLIALFVMAKPFVVINSGEVGIKSTTGKFNTDPLSPGFHLFLPFVQKVRVVDTKVRSINYTSNAQNNMSNIRDSGVMNASTITALDKRGLLISIDITIQYRLRSQTAPQTIATYGHAWEEKIINPIVRDVVRAVTGSYKAEELPVKRNEIATAIRAGIEAQIDAKAGNPVELTTVNLREIILPPKIVEQIERVQIAKQEGDRVQLEVLRAKQEAEKVAALAQGQADARIIQAQGQANSIRIEADAKAYENIEIGKSLTVDMLTLKQIEVQGKFNDALRTNTNAQIFLTPGGSTPNIWVDSKGRQQKISAEQ
jgi:regulator of protease activity HflC (stomatin/prohibitin superfamily)